MGHEASASPSRGQAADALAAGRGFTANDAYDAQRLEQGGWGGTDGEDEEGGASERPNGGSSKMKHRESAGVIRAILEKMGVNPGCCI